MKNQLAIEIMNLENEIEKVKKEFEYLMKTHQLDIYEELDYRLYLSDLYERYDELTSL